MTASLTTLNSCKFYDVRRRYEILHDEAQHLADALGYLSAADRILHSTAESLISRIELAAKTLLGECAFDAKEVRRSHDWYLEVIRGSAPTNASAQRAADVAHQFALMINAKFHVKVTALAERLGNLHGRVEFLLHRRNPDHPDPTLRRRSEQGLTDKFLSEHVRWVHRDLAQFAMVAKEKYPYTEVPATFHHWDYSHTSSQHSFASREQHNLWQARHDDSSDDNQASRLEPDDRFTALSLGYWMPERPALQPIIGHELGHQVLKDIFGAFTVPTTVAGSRGEIARLFRRLTACAENWFVGRHSENSGLSLSTELVRETVCDTLGIVRYGYGYLYAWFLEMGWDTTFAGAFHDEYGILTTFTEEAAKTQSQDSTIDAIERNWLRATKAWRDRPCIKYHRGRVLVALLEKIAKEPTSEQNQLVDAVKSWLEVLADVQWGKGTPERAIEVACADDFVETTTLRFPRMIGKPPIPSTFVQCVRTYRSRVASQSAGVANTNALAVQRCSEDLHAMFETLKLTDPLKRVGSRSNLVHTHDYIWMAEWSTQKRLDSKAGADNSDIQRFRSWLQLAMDDYLHNVRNPFREIRLLQRMDKTALQKIEKELANLTKATDEHHLDANTVDDKAFAQMYGHNAVKTRSDSAGNITYDLELTKDRIAIANGRGVGLLPSNRPMRALFDSKIPTVALYVLYKVKTPDGLYSLQRKISPNQDVTESVLLGRYDYVEMFPEIHVQNKSWPESVKRVGRHKKCVEFLSHSLSDNAPQATFVGPSLPSFVGPPHAESELFSIILVSTCWDGARLQLANWFSDLVKNLPNASGLHIRGLLSDGWEDLLIEVITTQKEHTDIAFVLTKELCARLGESLLVDTTETIFSTALLCLPQTTVDARFVVARGKLLMSEAKQMLNQFNNEADVSEVVGTKDLQVVPKRDTTVNRKRLHESLHDPSLRKLKVETRVSYSC